MSARQRTLPKPSLLTLKSTTRGVLTGLLVRRRPELLPLLDVARPSRQQIEEIVDVVADELAMYGFAVASTPTAYGHLLEDVIDDVNRIEFA